HSGSFCRIFHTRWQGLHCIHAGSPVGLFQKERTWHEDKNALLHEKAAVIPLAVTLVFQQSKDKGQAYAFSDEKGRKRNSCLELTVRVLNINYGHNAQLMERCGRLGEYAHFIAKIKEFKRAGQFTDEAVDNAMVYCMEHGIMEDILMPFWAEVKKMLLTEYNERKYMRMFRKEAREEGLKEGLKEGLAQGLTQGIREGQDRLIKAMLHNGVSAEKISEQTGLPLQEVLEAGKDKTQ
ncbi:MAG TPA: hypothetical protein DCZ91_12850, partial [Lachnospiraceae bacterium]|nr:hypothetical protein [Lachnospiraceae bacterium]